MIKHQDGSNLISNVIAISPILSKKKKEVFGPIQNNKFISRLQACYS